MYALNQNYSGSPPQLFISLLNLKIVQFKHSFKIPQAIIVVICRTNFQFTRSGGDHELHTPTYANTKGKYVYRAIFTSNDSNIDPQFHWLATAGPVARDLSPANTLDVPTKLPLQLEKPVTKQFSSLSITDIQQQCYKQLQRFCCWKLVARPPFFTKYEPNCTLSPRR